jgi:phenylalanyl-tRNA synthetase alpha chain
VASLTEQAEGLKIKFIDESARLREEPDPAKIEQCRVAYLGRKGSVTALFDALRDVSKEERPVAGKALNLLRQEVEKTLGELTAASKAYTLKRRLAREPLDISRPVGERMAQASLHPVSLIRGVLLKVFRQHGFTVYDGPEVDYDYYNFSALNFPDDHPAREMQDTFFVDGHDRLLLRTHTSNIQVHAMLGEKPPLRIIAPGRVFRCDNDPTHTPMFHQIEGFVVDRDINFAHLKGMLDSFLKAVFGRDLKTRFRPSFFPFVEPGAEVDLQCTMCRGKGCRVCKQTGWLEIGGCGMIHPNVFEAVQYDSEEWNGFAFGFGMDRMAMLAYALPDLRQLFEGLSEFQAQFPVFAR